MEIYVGNLLFDVTKDDLRALFGKFGEITEVRLIMDKFHGKSKGFAFIEMPSEDQAKKAIEEMNGTEFKDRALRVKEANPKKPQTRKSKKKRGKRKKPGARGRRAVYGGEDRDDITTMRRLKRGKI
jgi:RNA recognition motif-containing protein